MEYDPILSISSLKFKVGISNVVRDVNTDTFFKKFK